MRTWFPEQSYGSSALPQDRARFYQEADRHKSFSSYLGVIISGRPRQHQTLLTRVPDRTQGCSASGRYPEKLQKAYSRAPATYPSFPDSPLHLSHEVLGDGIVLPFRLL